MTTTRELIIDSFYLSGIVSRSLSTVSGDQIDDGLSLINSLLAFKTADATQIPYFTEYDFPSVANIEEYFIPGCIDVQTLTFDFGSVRYAMQPLSRKEYFATPRANNVASLPYVYHVERAVGGSNLFMYYEPIQVYPFKMYGKFSLGSVTLNQDLNLTLDPFYIEYIRYLLAAYICEFYDVSTPDSVSRRVDKYEGIISYVSPYDLRMSKVSILNKSATGPDIYVSANLTTWRPF